MKKSHASLRVAAILVAFFATFSAAEASPAYSLTFSIPSGALNPAGSVHFDQWISASSATAIPLAEGEEIDKTAILEFCDESQKNCPTDPSKSTENQGPQSLANSACTGSKCSTEVKPFCTGVKLPIERSCLLRVDVSASADGKGASVKMTIPPLRYNSVYRLKLALIGKKDVPVSAESLARVDKVVTTELAAIEVNTSDSLTAAQICASLKTAIESEFDKAKIKVDSPLATCAANGATTTQLTEMQDKIVLALDAQSDLALAKEDVNKAQGDIKTLANGSAEDLEAAKVELKRTKDRRTLKENEASRATVALRGSMRETIAKNAWLPVDLGTEPVASTARASYVSAEAGLLYGWDLKDAIPYIGANIYSRPINTDVSLASLEADGIPTWGHRLSLTLGTTVSSVEKRGQRKGLIGTSAVVVGVGARLSDVIRLSGGMLVYRKENPNPLVTDDQSLTVSPYVALSFDADIAKLFGKLFTSP